MVAAITGTPVALLEHGRSVLVNRCAVGKAGGEAEVGEREQTSVHRVHYGGGWKVIWVRRDRAVQAGSGSCEDLPALTDELLWCHSVRVWVGTRQ